MTERAESRQVTEETRDDLPVRAVSTSRWFATDREDLWNALTDPRRLPRWFLPVTGRLELGGRFQIEDNASGSVLKCDPPVGFEVSWEYADQVSWVRVTLAEDAAATRLTLTHLIPKDDVAEDHWRQFGPAATGIGWDLAFLGLELHLARGGEVIEQHRDEQWLASDAGRAFIQASGDRWRQAHVEAGEDPATASAMAKRSVDFYSGA